nr:hypothetical protein [Candidatus Njordarchaeum guaymaensis]
MNRKKIALAAFAVALTVLWYALFLARSGAMGGPTVPSGNPNSGEPEVPNTDFFQVPEYPLGTALGVVAALAALGALVVVKKK